MYSSQVAAPPRACARTPAATFAERDTLDIAPLTGKSEQSIIDIKEETEKGAGESPPHPRNRH